MPSSCQNVCSNWWLRWALDRFYDRRWWQTSRDRPSVSFFQKCHVCPMSVFVSYETTSQIKRSQKQWPTSFCCCNIASLELIIPAFWPSLATTKWWFFDSVTNQWFLVYIYGACNILCGIHGILWSGCCFLSHSVVDLKFIDPMAFIVFCCLTCWLFLWPFISPDEAIVHTQLSNKSPTLVHSWVSTRQ